MSNNKLDMTRPEFLTKFIADDDGNFMSMDDMQTIIPGSSDLIYCTYTVLMESNIKKSDITFIHNDGESIVIKFSDKSLVKAIKNNSHKETVTRGNRKYKIRVKDKDRQIIVSIDDVSSDDED